MTPLDPATCRRLLGELSLALEQALRESRRHPRPPSPATIESPPIVNDPFVRSREHPVFAGGAIMGLLVDDPVSRQPSPTKDIDAVVEILGMRDRLGFELQLQRQGFTQSEPGMTWTWKGTRVDLIICRAHPQDAEDTLFREVVAAAEPHRLESGHIVWRASAAGFLAMKFAAFRSPLRQHHGDFARSKDAGDILAVLEGRLLMERQIDAADPSLRRRLAHEAASWIAHRDFQRLLPLLSPDPGREGIILRRLNLLADWRPWQ